MNKFSYAIGLSILMCLALAASNVKATALADGPGVSLLVDLPDGKLCSKSENITIRIDNQLGEAIEVGSLSAARYRLREVKNDSNGEIRQVSEELPAAVFTSSIASEVGKDLTVAASLPIPSEDGAYSDVFTLKWRRAETEPWLYEDAFVKLEVADGCAEIISDLEYESLTNIYSLIPMVRDGKEVLELAVEGSGTFDGYETPWAEIDDGIEPVSTSAEEDVVIDGTPYLFVEPGYDYNVFDEELDGAYDEDAATASLSGKGGMATDAVLALNYCVKVRVFQDANQVSENTTGMRWWRPQVRIDNPFPEPDSFRALNFLGLVVQLYDRNSMWDTYITSAALKYTANGQYFCIPFEWDQAAHPSDLYPDPYIKTYYKVTKPRTTPVYDPKYGVLCNGSCTTCNNAPISWRDQYTSNLGQPGTSNTAYVTTYFTSTSNPNEDQVAATNSSRSIQMAYLQKFFEVWDDYKMTEDINVQWNDEGYPSASLTSSCINLFRYYDKNENGIPDVEDRFWHKRWDCPVHEAGHIYKNQVWDNAPGVNCGIGFHYGYCSYTYECAMNEGWAEFVSMRSWYPDDIDESEPVLYTNVDVFPVEPGGHELLGGSPFSEDDCGDYFCPEAEEGTDLWHDCYAKNEIMGMRAYWDMFDSNPDGIDFEGITVPWPYLVDVWELYAPGTGNHQLDESQSNMMDYLYNSTDVGPGVYGDIWTAMQNNSMTWQDPD